MAASNDVRTPSSVLLAVETKTWSNLGPKNLSVPGRLLGHKLTLVTTRPRPWQVYLGRLLPLDVKSRNWNPKAPLFPVIAATSSWFGQRLLNLQLPAINRDGEVRSSDVQIHFPFQLRSQQSPPSSPATSSSLSFLLRWTDFRSEPSDRR